MKPRNKFAAIIIALLLGPAAILFWLGRGLAGTLLLLLPIIFGAIFFALYRYTNLIDGIEIRVFVSIDVAYYLISAVAGLLTVYYGHKKFDLTPQKKWYSNTFVAIILIPIVALPIIAILIRSFFWQPFTIPASSMLPALNVGDYIGVEKSTYGYSKHSFPFSSIPILGRVFAEPAKRGDLVVFKLPANPAIDYVKRIVGLPGETIQLKNGTVFINGEPLKQTTIPENIMEGVCENLYSCPKMMREHVSEDVSYIVLDIANSTGDNTKEFLIPNGYYFLLGDNRDNSLDSRYNVGFVPFENLVGKVTQILWNINGVPYSDRLNGYAKPQ